MKKKEIREAIKTVYGELWSILSLYEVTECFNRVPKGEKSEDIWDYMGRKLYDVRRTAQTLFLGEPEIARELKRIIDETEYFVRIYEVPGVVKRWKEINPKILYFDCSFDTMEDIEDDEELPIGYAKKIPLSASERKIVEEKEKYFEEIREKNKIVNLRYSEDRIFQDEILNTLTLLFEKTFKEYL